MRILLDTHIFLGYITADPKLPNAYAAAIRDVNNQVYLSAAMVDAAVRAYSVSLLPTN
jgi:PIN domain nuclease of toxin-antitoxin system